VDPDGELAWFVPIIIGAVIGGTSQGIASANAGGSFWSGAWKGSLVGGAAGFAAVAATAALAGTSLTAGITASTGFGAIVGGGAAGGFVSGGFTSSINGGSFLGGAWRGALTGAVGAVLGTVGGGIESFAGQVGIGVGTGATTGALGATLNGGDIGQGALIGGAFGGAFAAATSPQLRNAVRGQGFRSNSKVLAGFVGRGDHQGALDYFGIEGTYAGEGQSSTYINRTTGETGIRFRSDDFTSYGALKSTYVKESFHLARIRGAGWELADTDYFPAARQPEERLGLIHQYKNRGFYQGHRYKYLGAINNVESQISMFNNGFYNSTYNFSSFQRKWWHFIYGIPRRY